MLESKDQVIEVTQVRDCHNIASEIKLLTKQGQQMALFYIVEIGQRLQEAKAMLSHGEWGEWLEKEVSYSQSTAENFMRIAEEYGKQQTSLFETAKSQSIENLGYTKLVALLAVPSVNRAEFAEQVNAEEISTRELQEKIKEYQISKETAEADKKALEETLSEQQKQNTFRISSLEREKETALKDAEKAESKVAELEEKIKEMEKASKEVPESELEKIRIEAEKQAKAEVEKKLAAAKEKAKKAEQKAKEAEAKIETAKKEVQSEYEKKLSDSEGEKKLLEAKAEQALEKVQTLEKQAAIAQSEEGARFKVFFEQVQKDFHLLSETLNKVCLENPEMGEKFKKATGLLLDNMKKKLEGVNQNV